MALKDGIWELAAEGNVFRPEWFKRTIAAGDLPEDLRWVRYYDLAASLKTAASRTASAAAALAKDGTLYIRDVWAGKIEWPDQEALIERTMLAEPLTVHGIEAKLHGLAAIQALTRKRELAGITIQGREPKGDKLQRAMAWSSRAEQGKVVLVDGRWIPDFIAEVVAFEGTGKTYDDQVDAVSGCVEMLANFGPPAAGTLGPPPAPQDRLGIGLRRGERVFGGRRR
jgi:predicted phage terminase large subunit-like protein